MRTNILTGMSALEILRAIDDWSTQRYNSEEVSRLWILVTALRGPDHGDPEETVKLRTTAIFRNWVAPNFAGSLAYVMLPANGQSVYTWDPQTLIDEINATREQLKIEDLVPSHFRNHLNNARESLLAGIDDAQTEAEIEETHRIQTRIEQRKRLEES